MNIRSALALLSTTTLLLPLHAWAATPVSPDLSAYRSYLNVGSPDVPVTSLVELPIDNLVVERYQFTVLDLGAPKPNHSVPFTFKNNLTTTPVTAQSAQPQGNINNLVDGKSQTHTDFTLPDHNPAQAAITLTSNAPIKSSALTLDLADNVARPTHVAITAGPDQQIVVAKKKLTSNVIKFPTTTASQWQVSLTYAQPLRISELRLQQDTDTQTNNRSIIWLAQPNHEYRVYFDPDRQPPPTFIPASYDQDDEVLTLPPASVTPNEQYVIADTDEDGIPNVDDNCISLANPEQEDLNQNGRGDKCEDFDRDGVLNHKDNCPDHPNRNQADEDGDEIGDACDNEESRLTEKYPWVPWIGMITAAVVLVVLFGVTAYSMKKDKSETPPDPPQPPADDEPDTDQPPPEPPDPA